jgi:hypothetical protein
MTKQILLLLFMLSTTQMAAYAQAASYAGFNEPQPLARDFVFQTEHPAEPDHESVLAARAIASVKRLNDDVLVYRSLGDFEADGRLARVPREVFNSRLQEVTAEVESILSRLPQSKLKIEIINALYSYRDGAFWWGKIPRPARVVKAAAMNFAEISTTPSEAVFMSTVHYTVVIHWRQAGKYLGRAEKIVRQKR